MSSAKSFPVSVIVTTFNDYAYLESAIESIATQSSDVEIIVVDDSSTDDSYKLLQKIQKKYSLTLLRTAANSGPSTARNLGMERARYEYAAFLDGDDYWLSGRLKKAISIVKNNSAIDVVFADAYMEENGKLTNTLQSSFMPVPTNLQPMTDGLFRRNCINMCAVLIKTSLAKQVQFDESLRSAEDYDFWLRVAATGAQFHYIDEPLVVYRKHGKSLSDKRLHSIASTFEVLAKNQHLAVTDTAKENLLRHKISLYEQQLQLADSKELLSETLEQLGSLRPLGKKERSVQLVNQASFSLGKVVRRRLINEGES